MKSQRVILTVTQPGCSGQHYVFDAPQSCLVGPANDCDIRVLAADDHEISCYYCLLLIDPPRIRVRNLFSRDGTFVNGRRLHHGPDDGRPDAEHATELAHGDVIRVGKACLQVGIISDGETTDSQTAARANRGDWTPSLPPDRNTSTKGSHRATERPQSGRSPGQ